VLAVTAINLTEATMKKADHKKAAFAFTQSAIVIYFLNFLLNPAKPKSPDPKSSTVQGSGNKFTSAPWSIGAESVKPKATLRMTLPGVGKLTRGLTPVNDRSARTKLSGRRASNSATERKDTAYTDTTLRSFHPPSTAFLTYFPP